MAVLAPLRAPSLGRHVYRALWRRVVLDLPPRIAATACHQRNDVKRYSRFIGTLPNFAPATKLSGRALHRNASPPAGGQVPADFCGKIPPRALPGECAPDP